MEGIYVRHRQNCGNHHGRRCNCNPLYVAHVWSRRDGKKIRKSFPTEAAARNWRTDAMKLVKDRKLRAPTKVTLQEEVDAFLEGAREGRVLSKREQPYKPSVVRSYELSLRLRVLPVLGNRRLDQIDLADLLELKEDLQASGVSASTIRNAFVPLQSIYRRARLAQRVAVDPTVDLPLPTAGSRDRAATPTQTAELVGLLDGAEAGIYATAFYAGLRRGELQALRVQDVDLEHRTVHVEFGWDPVERFLITPKSRAGVRVVFLADHLLPYLAPLVEGRNPGAFVLGYSDGVPFEARAVSRKAQRRWDTGDTRRIEDELAPLVRFGLHEARHSFASWTAAAGIPEASMARYLGHAAGTITRRYTHALDGQLADDRRLFDRYVAGNLAGKVLPLEASAA